MKKLIDENTINQAKADFDGIKSAIIAKGVSIPSGTPTSQYPAKIEAIKTGGTPSPSVPFGVNETWIDVEKAMAEDTNGYNLKLGMVIMNDEVEMLAKHNVSGGTVALITTSDGGYYTTFNDTHTWDSTKDIQSYVNGKPSIKTRWIIVHISNSTSPTANLSATPKDNCVYAVYDGIQFGNYSLYNKTRVRTIKPLNGAKFHSSITDFSQAFYGMNDLMSVDDSWGLDKGLVFYQAFYNCTKLEVFKSVAKPTDVRSMFQNCTNLESVEMDLTNCTQTTGFLTGCTDISNLLIKGLKVSTTIASGTSYGSMLSQFSLHFIIDNAQTVSGQTLTMGSANKAKIDSDYLATAVAKGWTIV